MPISCFICHEFHHYSDAAYLDFFQNTPSLDPHVCLLILLPLNPSLIGFLSKPSRCPTQRPTLTSFTTHFALFLLVAQVIL